MAVVKLRELAHTRTGDKGDTCNLAVIAYRMEDYPLLAEQLTAKAVEEFYRGTIDGPVERYEIPQIGALNFVMHGALGGGVSRTLRLDNYGKALSSAILNFEIETTKEGSE
jgi:hypothetical protein